MGTLTSLEKLYDNIAKSNHPAPAPDRVRAEAERYTVNVTTGVSSMESLYSLFDQAFPGSPGVRRFSRSERAQRKAVSARVRQAMSVYVSISAVERDTIPEAPPWVRNFLVPTGYGEDADIFRDQNQKRILELQPDTEDGRIYMQSVYIPLIRSENPELTPEQAEAQAKQEIRKLQSDFTESFVLFSADVMEKLDQMADPNLPTDTLAGNIEKIVRAKRICDCMETYLEQANNGTLALSAETKAVMERQIKLRPRLTMAVNKLEAMANPMYEYFDTDQLGAYDLSAIRTVWEENFLPRRDPAWREGKNRKHSHFQQYVTPDVRDNFTNFLENAANFSEARQELSRRQLQEAVAEYGFDPQEVIRFRETPSTVDSPEQARKLQRAGAIHTLDGRQNLRLYQDAPIAYHQGNRAVIFTPADTLTGVTANRPEALYNYSFNGSTANLEKALKDADRWYKTNKHGYGSMRQKLREIAELGKLSQDCTQEDIHNRREAYQALLQSSETYIHSKGENAQGRDEVERARIAAAKRAKNYAEMKIKELDLITKARATAAQRQNAAQEQIHIPDNEEGINAAPKGENADNNFINADVIEEEIGGNLINENPEGANHALREDNPVRPLHQRYSEKFAKDNQLPKSLAALMEENLKELEWRWDDGGLMEINIDEQDVTICSSLYRSLGAITAVEMILAERKRLGGNDGPMERFFAEADEDFYTNLGYQASVPFETDALLNEETAKATLQAFDPKDPRFDMERFAAACTELHQPMFRQNIAARYRSDLNLTGDPQRDNALQQFVQTHILDGLEDRLQEGFLEQAPKGENLDYLAGCMVRDIVLLERGDDPSKKPGALEEQMMNSPEELIKDIKNAPSFQYRTSKMCRLKQKMNAVFTGSTMKDLVISYINNYNSRINEAKEGDVPEKPADSKEEKIDVDKMSESEKRKYAEKEIVKIFNK